MRIERYTISGTKLTCYDVWEHDSPSDGEMFAHSTITTFEGGRWWGRLGTRSLPNALERMRPYSEARSRIVAIYHNRQYHQAYQAIIDQYPEALHGYASMGEITVKS